MKKRFAIIGVGGYVANKHLEAIKSVDGELVACCDINDSVGIIDSYFPNTNYFKEISGFEKYLEELSKSSTKRLDYFVICTPNHLHDFHIEMGLRNNSNVICEKPIVTNPNLLKNLFKLENNYKKNIFCILQLRQNKNIKLIKNEIENKDFVKCNLEYITPRGNWYDSSWKGNESLSGGILFNIGVHLFDFLLYLFGDYESFKLDKKNKRNVTGTLFFSKAEVNWKLSLDSIQSSMKGRREIIINKKKFDLTKNFHSSHINCYESILNNDEIFLAKNACKAIYLINKMKKVINE